MAFVFGWYSFKLKSYSIEDLNLDKELWTDSIFEVRQEVFHIFWIPVFSLGKLYVVRKQDKIYDIPDQVVSKIKTKGKVKTPWYSFLFPILAVIIPILVSVYINIAESIMRHNNYKNDKEQYEASISEVQNRLNNLSKNAYLQLFNTEKPNFEEIFLLKLVDIEENSYKFQVKKVHHPKNSNENYYFENVNSDTLTYTKNELKKAICTDYDVIGKRKTYGINFLNNGKSIISKIEYFDKPVITGEVDWFFWENIERTIFHYDVSYSPKGNEIRLILQNFGIPADLIEIKNIENKIEWSDELPIHFDTYHYLKEIQIRGIATESPNKLKFKSLFIFQDSIDNKYEFIVESKEEVYTIRRKE